MDPEKNGIEKILEEMFGADEENIESLLSEFNTQADKLPDENDTDKGILLLEEAIEKNENPTVKKKIAAAIINRALNFASKATSGGEGLSRGRYAESLKRKYKNIMFFSS